MATSVAPRLTRLLILDFEATCGNGIGTAVHKRNQEIIEWPTLLYNIQTDTLEATFHQYIRPVVVPQLTAFCTELTGIEQVRNKLHVQH
jgi:ERI1 exoribonuclease 3